MATMEIEGIAEMIRKFEEFGEDIGDIIDESLIAAGDIVVEEWRAAAIAAGHDDTGGFVNSFTRSPKPKTVSYEGGSARQIEIYAKGADAHGDKYTWRTFRLNYGFKGFSGSRFVDVAARKAEPRISQKMQEIYDRKVQEKGLT